MTLFIAYYYFLCVIISRVSLFLTHHLVYLFIRYYLDVLLFFTRHYFRRYYFFTLLFFGDIIFMHQLLVSYLVYNQKYALPNANHCLQDELLFKSCILFNCGISHTFTIFFHCYFFIVYHFSLKVAMFMHHSFSHIIFFSRAIISYSSLFF